MNAIVCMRRFLLLPARRQTNFINYAGNGKCSGRDGAKDYTASYTASSTYVGSFTIGVFLLLYANCCLRSVFLTTLGIAPKLPDN
ncbi:hypothetical protein ALC53_12285 [Atta colombica]|uniref:Uncharacterized protein n=1 Tax=Atta colombica TaxID=520822 RepID=A0A195AZB9_9HYME|nr:hypothetical protein ALC53_12285 [Atta colombica]